MPKVEETALAKVNLDLRVHHRRADGYHELDSLVAFAAIGDQLTLDHAHDLELTIDGPFGEALPDDDGNLIVAAAKALATMAGREPRIRIMLDKRLPIAAGLGGGSADAAATLRGLIRLWNLPLPPADLLPLARSLGADVPVCLGSTATRMQGIGERLSPVSLPADLPVVLVNPGVAVATPDVFRGLGDVSGPRRSVSRDPNGRTVGMRLGDGVNDLEAPAIALVPMIGTVLDTLRLQPGCSLARMSGSGATCFGLFENVAARDLAATTLAASHPDWWTAATVLR